MNCNYCGKAMKTTPNSKTCRNKECELYNVSITLDVYEYPRANLYKNVQLSPIHETINYILNFKLRPEHLILLTLALAYGLCMIWIGMLLTPKVIG